MNDRIMCLPYNFCHYSAVYTAEGVSVILSLFCCSAETVYFGRNSLFWPKQLISAERDCFCQVSDPATLSYRPRFRFRFPSVVIEHWLSDKVKSNLTGHGPGARALLLGAQGLHNTACFKFFCIRTDGAQGNQVWSIDTWCFPIPKTRFSPYSNHVLILH